MMRSLLTAAAVAATLQNVLAQDAQTTPAPSTSTSEEELNISYSSSRSSHSSSLSSRIGPFFQSVVFAPAVSDYDYLSILGSGGPNDPKAETTTYRAYMKDNVEDPDQWTKAQAMTTMYAYQNFTVGPTTYLASQTFGDWVVPVDDFYGSSGSTTFPASDATTICSITAIAPKISIPDSVWATQDFETLVSDNWPTYSAVCEIEAHYTIKGSVSDTSTVVTYSEEQWKYVTIMGEDKHTMTKTGTAGGAEKTGAAQEGSGSGSKTEGAKATSTQAAGASEVTAWVNAVVVVAAAAVMAV